MPPLATDSLPASWFVFLSSYRLQTNVRQTVLLALFVVQLVLIVLRSQHEIFSTQASLAADILAFVATGCLIGTCAVELGRSIRPTTLTSLYLSAFIIFGIARSRTAWLIGGSDFRVPSLTVAETALAAVALLLESFKNSSISQSDKTFAPEEYSGFWNRAIFAWLADTFRLGYVRVLALDDLPTLDSRLGSNATYQQLASAWSTCKMIRMTTGGPWLIC